MQVTPISASEAYELSQNINKTEDDRELEYLSCQIRSSAEMGFKSLVRGFIDLRLRDRMVGILETLGYKCETLKGGQLVRIIWGIDNHEKD